MTIKYYSNVHITYNNFYICNNCGGVFANNCLNLLLLSH